MLYLRSRYHGIVHGQGRRSLLPGGCPFVAVAIRKFLWFLLARLVQPFGSSVAYPCSTPKFSVPLRRPGRSPVTFLLRAGSLHLQVFPRVITSQFTCRRDAGCPRTQEKLQVPRSVLRLMEAAWFLWKTSSSGRSLGTRTATPGANWVIKVRGITRRVNPIGASRVLRPCSVLVVLSTAL